MTVRIGSNVIAPGIASNEEFLEGLSEDKTATVKQLREEFSRVDRLPLFAPMRSPYLLNDVSWLRSDTFSWHNGDIYISAYNLLATLYTDNSATTSSDTIEGITITYKRVSNGMKICDSDQENNLINLYNSVGVAWYFLIDTTDKKFKLPRNKFDFTGFRTAAGDYVEESLPNITGEVHAEISQRALGWSGSGVFKGYKVTGNNANPASLSNTADHNNGFEFDASLSSSTYKDNAPVQERAVQSYLYFYVGRFTPTSIEQSAGLNTEALDDKADKDLGNLSTGLTNTICIMTPTTLSTASSARPAVIIENYRNGTEWYRVWSDGWIEQGGVTGTARGTETVTYLKAFSDTNYFITKNANSTYSASGASPAEQSCYNLTTTGFTTMNVGSSYGQSPSPWYACGY